MIPTGSQTGPRPASQKADLTGAALSQPASAASVKGQLQTLEDLIKMLREEEGEVTKEVQRLRAEKDTLENDLNHLCIEGREYLQSEVIAGDEEMQRHISSQKAENSRLQLQITQLKADKASLTDQIIRLTQRIQDIESALGADSHAG